MQRYLKGFLLLSVLLGAAYGDDICYPDVGCFTSEPPWANTEERPGNDLPNSPDEVNVKFFLDTNSDLDVQVFNYDMHNLGQTTFNSKYPVKFIVHGFLQNGDTKWLNDMSDALLSQGLYNVIRISWPGGSTTFDYPQSAQDTQVVGAEIALFINNAMYAFNMDSEEFHCIGHSLGAQACSYLGARVSPRIGRITGLDPAGPYFENTPLEVRLDSTDAMFVDVIHTDAAKLIDLGFGINQVSGHVDFWPNNGIEQPGCDQNILSTIFDKDGIWEGTQNFVACNHLRALDFFTESITTSCPFAANPCSSYDDYLAGKCNSCNGNCARMGYNSIQYGGSLGNHNFFLETEALEPYCEYMTYVEVELGSNSDSVEGRLYLTLYGTNSNTEQDQLSDEDVNLQLRPSQTFSYVAQYKTFPAGFNRVKLLWTQEQFTVTTQHLTVSQIRVWANHDQKWYYFNGDIGTKLDENVRYTYYAQ